MTTKTPRPIKAAHELMLTKLVALQPPYLSANPSINEFRATQEYLLDVARIVDQMLLEVGREVKSNCSTVIDLKLFDNVLLNALEGEAVYAIDQEINEISEARAA